MTEYELTEYALGHWGEEVRANILRALANDTPYEAQAWVGYIPTGVHEVWPRLTTSQRLVVVLCATNEDRSDW